MSTKSYNIGGQPYNVEVHKNIFGGYGDYSQDKMNMGMQAELDSMLAKYQYDMNLEQWERENAYNSPIQQMQRLKSAGLNPHLAYDSLQNQSAPSPQMQQVQTKLSYGQYRHNVAMENIGLMEQMNNLRYQSAQIDNLIATNEVLKLEGVNKALGNMREFENVPYYGENARYSSDALRLQNENIIQSLSESNWRMREGTANNLASRKQIYASIGLTNKQASLIEHQIHQIDSDLKRQAFLATITAAQTFSNIRLNQAQIGKIASEITKLNAESAKDLAFKPIYDSAYDFLSRVLGSQGDSLGQSAGDALDYVPNFGIVGLIKHGRQALNYLMK